jgi:hypothetical protein
MVKVLCVRIIAPVTMEEVLDHPGIRLHDEYPVLAIQAQPGRAPEIRILTDDGTPALFDARMFATTESSIPANWIARVREGGVVDLAPESWLELGFWERYFDRDPAAVRAFETELRSVLGDPGG